MKVYELLADFLQHEIITNSCNTLEAFNAKQVPYISIRDYITRFNDYLHLDTSTYIVAYILIERLLNRNPRSRITALNVHRLVVTAITITEKNINDWYWRNMDYAMVGAITNEELNKLEVEFLKMIDYDMKVKENDYINALNKITRIV